MDRESSGDRSLEPTFELVASSVAGLVSGLPLADVLERLALAAESRLGRATAAFMLLDQAMRRLKDAGGPHLAKSVRQFLHGLEIGPLATSGGAAASQNAMIITTDIANDPAWEKWREAMLAHHLVSCWSIPIANRDRSVAGVLMVYFDSSRRPAGAELDFLSFIADLAATAIQMRRADNEILEARSQTERSNRRVMDAIDALPEGFLLFDNHGRLVLVNEEVKRRYAESNSSLVMGLTIKEMLHEGIDGDQFAVIKDINDAPVLALLEGYRKGDRKWYPLQYTDDYWIKCSVSPTRDGGRVMLTFDVSEEVKRNDALIEATERAKRANEAKSRFLANISHELRTPLNAILGFSSMITHRIGGGGIDETYLNYIRDIQASGQYLLSIVQDILDVSLVESGRLELREREIEISEPLQAAVRLLLELSARSRVEIQLSTQGTDRRVRADPKYLQQIVVNLLSNAVKFSHPDSIVRLGCSLNGVGELEIVVQDQGIGMSPEHLQEALLLFGRVENPMQSSHAGVGLGLPLAKSLVEAHSGRLEIFSQLARGTTAKVIIPSERVLTVSHLIADEG